MKIWLVRSIIAASMVLSGCSIFPWQDKMYEDLAIKPLATPPCGNAGDLACRDKFIVNAFDESNRNCVAHLKTIYGNDAAFNISTGTFALVTSAAASISSGTKAKTLSAFSTLANGERALVNEAIYKNQVTSAIGTKISDMRDTKGKAIRASLAQSGYSASQAYLDMMDYHNSCSFYYGLQVLLKEGSDSTPALKLSQLQNQRLNIIQKISQYTDAKRLNSTDQATNLKDPVYSSYVAELASIDAQIVALSGAGTAVSKDKNALSLTSDSTNGMLDLEFATPPNSPSALQGYIVNLLEKGGAASVSVLNFDSPFKGRSATASPPTLQGTVFSNQDGMTTLRLSKLPINEGTKTYQVQMIAKFESGVSTLYQYSTVDIPIFVFTPLPAQNSIRLSLAKKPEINGKVLSSYAITLTPLVAPSTPVSLVIAGDQNNARATAKDNAGITATLDAPTSSSRAIQLSGLSAGADYQVDLQVNFKESGAIMKYGSAKVTIPAAP